MEESDTKIEKLVRKFINKIYVTKFEESIDASNLKNLRTLIENIFELDDILKSKQNFIKSITKLDFNKWKTEIEELGEGFIEKIKATIEKTKIDEKWEIKIKAVENLIIREYKENFTKMIIKIGLIEDFTKQKKIIIIEQLGENPNEDDLLEKTIQIEGLEKVVKNFINEIDKIKGLENDFMDFIEQKIEKKYEKGEEIKKNVEKALHWY